MGKDMVKIELESYIRNFIIKTIDSIFFENMLHPLKKARANKYGYINCSINRFDLDQIIGELSYVANHDNDPHISEIADMAAEILEIY